MDESIDEELAKTKDLLKDLILEHRVIVRDAYLNAMTNVIRKKVTRWD